MPRSEPQPASNPHWNPEDYARHAGYVPALGAPLLELLAARPGERVLDLGCGDGALTEQLAAPGAAVTGIDPSAAMVAAARARGLDARLGDARSLPFESRFDAVFTNAALHWVDDHDAVVAGVRRALSPGGRFVGEFGGHGNIAAIVVALLAVLMRRGIDGGALLPWNFPTTERFAGHLAAHGFTVELCALVPRPTPLPTGIDGWLETFAGGILGCLDPADRTVARDEVAALLRPALCDDQSRWHADYVRLRFAARLPG